MNYSKIRCPHSLAGVTAEQTFDEGQNLLDLLSLPVKNASGQDVTPDNRPHMERVERIIAGLRDRKLRCDELADMKSLKLQQILQLRICEKDADQVCVIFYLLFSSVTTHLMTYYHVHCIMPAQKSLFCSSVYCISCKSYKLVIYIINVNLLLSLGSIHCWVEFPSVVSVLCHPCCLHTAQFSPLCFVPHPHHYWSALAVPAF